eukprot:Rhum_TRINITY_DN15700_c0_g1::Rhum_TRINITY_DN15700_c0_g1_i1::g.161889::m.161889
MTLFCVVSATLALGAGYDTTVRNVETLSTSVVTGEFPMSLAGFHIGIISALVSMTALATAAAVFISTRRKLRLPAVLFLVIWTAIFTVGIITWLVTYITTRDTLQETCTAQLTAFSRELLQVVSREINTGLTTLHLIRDSCAAGLFLRVNATEPLRPDSPYLHERLARVATAGGLIDSETIDAVRMGFEDGREMRISLDRVARVWTHNYTAYEAEDLVTLPPDIRCDPVDMEECQRYSSDRDTTCQALARENRTHECGKLCGLTEPAQINCKDAMVSWQTGANLTNTIAITRVSNKGYNVRLQDWYYRTDRGLAWYIGPVGLRAALKFNVKTACAAKGSDLCRGLLLARAVVDFDLNKLQGSLAASRPTENGVIAVSTLSQELVASSLTPEELYADVCLAHSKYCVADESSAGGSRPRIIPIGNINNPTSRVKKSFDVVTSHYGSLEESPGLSILHDEGDVVLSVLSSMTERHDNDRSPYMRSSVDLVMTLILPYSDLVGVHETAGVLALMIVVTISTFCGCLVYLTLSLALRPLNTLGLAMNRVAVMELDVADSQPPLLSRIAEVASMQESFHHMALNLIEYRKYLPQTVLLNLQDDAAEHPRPKQPLAASPSPTPSPSSAGGRGSRSFPLDRANEGADGNGAASAAGRANEASDVSVGHHSVIGAAAAAPALGGSGHSAAGQEQGSGRKAMHLLAVKKHRTFSLSLLKKLVSVAAMNLQGFVQSATRVSRTSLVALHSHYIDAVMKTVKDYRGVADSFSGDKVLATFNAALQCGAHTDKSTACAFHLAKRLGGDERLRVNVAVCTGLALCGNLGCPMMKKYNVIGEVASTVRTVERLGSAWSVAVIVDSSTVSDTVRASYELRKIVKVSDGRRSTMLTEVVEERHDGLGNAPRWGSSEWVEELIRDSAPSPTAEDEPQSLPRSQAQGTIVSCNAAVDHIYRGQYEAAAQILRGLPEDDEHVSALSAWVERCQMLYPPQHPPRALPLHYLNKSVCCAPSVAASWSRSAQKPSMPDASRVFDATLAPLPQPSVSPRTAFRSPLSQQAPSAFDSSSGSAALLLPAPVRLPEPVVRPE